MSWDTAGADNWGSGGGGGAAATSSDSLANADATNGNGDAATNSGEIGGNDYGGGADYGAGGGEGGGGYSGGDCFNCGSNSHAKADCPEPPKPRSCFNCGEEGHNKAECTNPSVARAFTGTCRVCQQEGHRASDCPQAPPKLCSNCKEEGHSALQCKSPRKIDRSDIEDVSAELAWDQLKAASEEGDLDDMKEAALKYIKATPDATYVQLEQAFRGQGLKLFLIATEKELQPTFTNMDLQGNLDRTFTVSWRKSPNHQRPKEKDSWPSSPEENLERLANAGEPVDRGIPKCGNCEKLGHIHKYCTEERVEKVDRVIVQCYNCNEIGHRVRDCPAPRPDKFACRNCHKSGHSSKECPEPRSAEGVECKKCGEVGHFSRDCPTAPQVSCHNCGETGHRKSECTNERVFTCRNCDETGHLSKECPKPRDYSRVQCQNCKQMGHTKVRCKEPLADEDDTGNASGYEGGDAGAPGGYSGGHGVAGKPSSTNGYNPTPAVDTGAGDEWGSGATGGAGGEEW
ncbi:hypothetical protein B7494_g3855 [Chlorociboria aeruginascens]|nr:hypothetical protein B7494_g3855 [Chlorociboria aeruginascens]